jgi:hypothetical protein
MPTPESTHERSREMQCFESASGTTGYGSKVILSSDEDFRLPCDVLEFTLYLQVSSHGSIPEPAFVHMIPDLNGSQKIPGIIQITPTGTVTDLIQISSKSSSLGLPFVNSLKV